MSKPDDVGLDPDRWYMLESARAFYLRDESKTEIADRLGISRFKVARLLEQARQRGIVRITILDGEVRGELAPRLAEHLQIEECVVVTGAPEETLNRQALARAAAAFLMRTIQRDDSFGLSWGRTLAEIGNYIGPLPASTAVALTGGVGTDFQQSPVEVLRTVAEGSGVQTMSIFAPLFVESPESAAALRRVPAIASVLARYASLDLAILSVGSWRPRITQLIPALTAAERDELDQLDVRAEVVGAFFDDQGRVVETSLSGRRIAVLPRELVTIPRVLAVAGGESKVPALAAVARSRILTALITDEQTARLLLETEPVTPGARRLSTRPLS
ncbi:MAG: hypothetical protein LKI24_03940 [Acidipropionibacterium sp.]|jgi:DNA-binding transcriptional regulator LsrR (DeoR family)|nr:hypothetical protein [Acidipropionibacterium sp.]